MPICQKETFKAAIPSKDRTVRISSDNTNEIGNLSIYIYRKLLKSKVPKKYIMSRVFSNEIS